MSKSIYYVDAAKFNAALLNSGKAKPQIMAETGFSKQTINNMLREKYCKSYPFAMSTILAVAAACGCTAAELLADEPKPEPVKECRLFDEPDGLDVSPAVARARIAALEALRDTVNGLQKLHAALMALWFTEAKP